MVSSKSSSKFELLYALRECSRSRDLQRGKMLHVAAAETGLDSNMYIASTLLHMYARCGRTAEAREVFDRMRHRDVVSWNALLLGYAANGEGYLALELLLQMNCVPDSLTYVAGLKACIDLAAKEDAGAQKHAKLRSLEKGMAIHSRAAEQRCDSNMRLSNVLIDMYVKCGSTKDAQHAFGRMRDHDVVTWTVLIRGYADNGQEETALQQFSCMLQQGCDPNSMTFVAALKACSSLGGRGEDEQACGLEQGSYLHSTFLRDCCEPCIFVDNTLVDMYGKCGSAERAREVFDRMEHRDIVSWNVLILGYAENGQGKMALEMFSRMEREGVKPDDSTFVAALKACTSIATRGDTLDRRTTALNSGMAIHSQAVRYKCDRNMYVASTLVDLYAKCGCLKEAREVFESMHHRDVVSWSALILGYADNGEGMLALELFFRMRREGCVPNSVVLVAALKACAVVGALEQGKALHEDIKTYGFEHDVVVATSLVDFYAKCSSTLDARRAFDAITNRNSVAWGAILAAYSRHGDANQVFEMFRRMEQDDRVKPSVVTFTSVLSACNHAGLVKQATEYFDLMVSKYGIAPSIEHYTCLIDLFGRANKLEEAVKLMNSMPLAPDAVAWIAILGACNKWKHVELGRVAFEALLGLDPGNSSIYVLMADIYKARGMAREQSQVLEMARH